MDSNEIVSVCECMKCNSKEDLVIDQNGYIYCRKCWMEKMEKQRKLTEHELLMKCIDALTFSNNCLDNCANLLDIQNKYVTTASGVAKECIEKNTELLKMIKEN